MLTRHNLLYYKHYCLTSTFFQRNTYFIVRQVLGMQIKKG